ncbi:serine/threonine-protein kinase [Streptomyces iconiensis]|uniref:Serine/threonine-protein kinase n=1 Tax=Streptomyces iconiensis TaxID=1384038 RepID=A0ABT6ZXH9_9ACTN|nr:serine/threonine-protein kinase [Streptomyces iconiensis]MDJ1133775.1 serine/threonine-protein kinase [Streptomyces iconiensis]
MQPLEPDDPRALGEYTLLRRLGAGGMGRVYLARSHSGRTVAVKVVHPHFAVDEQFRRRFRREVESARRVGGDWTAPVLDADPEGPTPWVATGYVAGPSLSHAVEEHGPLPETSVRAMGAGLAEALRHVHGLGLVHRDVKPSNVLLAVEGPRLIDFGIARATEGTASLTSTGVSIGSPGYMSPEQVLGEGVDGATDLFSLGAVLAYAATGKAPFPGDSSAALLYKVVHEEPELDGLEGGLRELIAACLSKAAADRPLPQDVADELAGSAGGAAGLVRTGWLPAPIVEQVGRRAVELLSLEPEAHDASGPVPFSRASSVPVPSSPPPPVPPAAPAVPGAPAGFGPPDPSYGGATGNAGSGEGGSGAGGTGAPGTGPGAGVAAMGTAPGEGKGSGKGDGSGERAGRRRVSCTVVVSFACVVAAALLGSYFLGFLGFLPGQGDSAGDDSARPRPTPTVSDSGDANGSGGSGDPGGSGGSEPTGKPGGKVAVPREVVGTWRGDLTFKSGTPGGEMTVKFEEGGKDETVAKGATRITGLECTGTWKLRDFDGKKLTLDSYDSSNAPGICTGDVKGDTFTLVGKDTLRFASGGEGPTGTLRKTG